MRIKTIYLLFLFSSIYSCDISGNHGLPEKTEGYVPIYSRDPSLKKITSEPARTSLRGGKIYTVGSLLFQVELDSGIHVINYANPANPQNLGFIKSFLCKEVSVKDGLIYTNNLSDLVVIDIRNWSNVREISRVEGVFPDLVNQFPEKDALWEIIYFECPDPRKGTVIAWQKQTISNPKCWR
jgi:hypothetical protein